MEKLRKMCEILNLLKKEYELSTGENNLLSTAEVEMRLERSLDDVKMLTLVHLFLDITDNENILRETSLVKQKHECEALRNEFHFLTKKVKHNQIQIDKLELENIKLKTDLRLNKISKPNQNYVEGKPNFISPSYIHSSFKFDLISEKEKKYLENNEDIKLPSKMKTMYDLVMQYTIKGNYEVAIPLCEQTLTDIEKNCSRYSNDYATMLHVLANVYRDIGDYQKSVNVMLEVLILRENTPETPKIKIVKTLNCISILYGLMYCWKEAVSYCRRSLAIMRKIYVGQEVNIAKQLETMAIIYKSNSQSEEAIECLKEVLDIYRTNGLIHIDDVTRVQSQIASCYLSQFQFDVSLDIYKEILAHGYQLHLLEIWEIKKPLWKIAEEYQYDITPVVDEMKSNYIDIRLLDSLDVSGLRAVLYHMAFIYRQLHMNKAAKFLETWSDQNIPTPGLPKQSFKSRSLMNLNEEIDVKDIHNEGFRLEVPRRSLNYINQVGGTLKMNIRDLSKKHVSKRSSVSIPRKSKDFDITIFESWSKSFIIKRQK